MKSIIFLFLIPQVLSHITQICVSSSPQIYVYAGIYHTLSHEGLYPWNGEVIGGIEITKNGESKIYNFTSIIPISEMYVPNPNLRCNEKCISARFKEHIWWLIANIGTLESGNYTIKGNCKNDNYISCFWPCKEQTFEI